MKLTIGPFELHAHHHQIDVHREGACVARVELDATTGAIADVVGGEPPGLTEEDYCTIEGHLDVLRAAMR
jgi:hypothetical protein